MVLKHIHSKIMKLENITFERTGKSVLPKAGYIYPAMNPNLLPLKKYRFEIGENMKKVTISV